jgi:hypothetical protein
MGTALLFPVRRQHGTTPARPVSQESAAEAAADGALRSGDPLAMLKENPKRGARQ